MEAGRFALATCSNNLANILTTAALRSAARHTIPLISKTAKTRRTFVGSPALPARCEANIPLIGSLLAEGFPDIDSHSFYVC